MSLVKIVAIPTIIIIIINWWAEGQVLDAILKAFGVNPIIIALISIAGFIAIIKIVLDIL